MACAVYRAKERKEREEVMQEAHKERRIKTVMSLKHDLEVNEVLLFSCVMDRF